MLKHRIEVLVCTDLDDYADSNRINWALYVQDIEDATEVFPQLLGLDEEETQIQVLPCVSESPYTVRLDGVEVSFTDCPDVYAVVDEFNPLSMRYRLIARQSL